MTDMIPFKCLIHTVKRVHKPLLRAFVLILVCYSLNPLMAQPKRAVNFFEEGRYDQAIRILKKNFYPDADDVKSGILLAEALYKTHDYEEALDVLNLISTDRMTESKEILLYADVLIANDDFSGAYLALIEWLSISETDADAFVWLDKTADLLGWDSLRTFSEVVEMEGLNTYANEYAPFKASNGDLWFISDVNSLQAVFPAAFTNQNVHLYHRASISPTDSLKVVKPGMLMKTREYYYHDGALTRIPQQEEYALTLREIDGLQHALKTGIYFSHLTGAEDDVRPFEYNGKFNTGHPTFSIDGTRMYFASDRKGGYGGMDIWYSDYHEGVWSEPVNLGPEVNTSANEVYPTWHNFRLFYSSDRRDMGYGGLDVYYVSLLNKPYKPYNLRTPINTAYDDFSIHFTKQSSGYIASNRLGGAGGDDIYAMIFVPEQMPIDTIEFKIFPLSDTPPLVAVYDMEGVRVAEAYPDEYGIASFAGLSTASVYRLEVEGEENTDYTIFGVDEMGGERRGEETSKNNLHFEVLEDQILRFVREEPAMAATESTGGSEDTDASEGQALTASADEGGTHAEAGGSDEKPAGNWTAESQKDSELKTLPEGMKYLKSIPNVYYDFDRFHLREDAKKDLDELAEVMLENKYLVVHVISHTDSRGAKAYNQRLSERRAKSVIDYLLEKGITADRMTSEGKGEMEPTNGCKDGVWCSNEDHALNRRTEFVFSRRNAPTADLGNASGGEPRRASIGPFASAFVKIHVCAVDHAVAARSGIVSRKVPVSAMVGTSRVKSLEVLKQDVHFATEVFGGEQF